MPVLALVLAFFFLRCGAGRCFEFFSSLLEGLEGSGCGRGAGATAVEAVVITALVWFSAALSSVPCTSPVVFESGIVRSDRNIAPVSSELLNVAGGCDDDDDDDAAVNTSSISAS